MNNDIYTKMLKPINSVMDRLFYDVNSLTNDEQAFLREEVTKEGAILVISPKASQEKIISLSGAKELLNSEYKELKNFVIAGVGSSDIGGAALARNVADYFNEKVGAIIAGYGIVDILSEGLEGWLSLGLANRASQYFEEMNEAMNPNDDVWDNDIHPYLSNQPDSLTLFNILKSENSNIKFILGHSKGCLSLANALNGFVSYSKKSFIEKRASELKIITTGAIVEVPDIFQNCMHQFLGSIDTLGGMNSSFFTDFEPVWGAWHHTNTKLPFSMSINDILCKSEKYNPLCSCTNK